MIEQRLRTAFGGRSVLLTGHTGFKGSWLSLWLTSLGARVHGYALAPDQEPSLFELAGVADSIETHCVGDVRDRAGLAAYFRAVRPEFVFHLAAQPLVRLSYEDPAGTFDVNLMGTVNVLECARHTDSVRVCQVVTTDKVYAQTGQSRAFNEADRLGGVDPYSASKACAELACEGYAAILRESGISLATARAGNVIGGGDWARDRLVPDCVRAIAHGTDLVLRYPGAVRPWQHVLDPLLGYLLLAAAQRQDPEGYAGAWNFGPADDELLTAEQIAREFFSLWFGAGNGRPGVRIESSARHEAHALRINADKAAGALQWRSRYTTTETLKRTVSWYKQWLVGQHDAAQLCTSQLCDYMRLLDLATDIGTQALHS